MILIFITNFVLIRNILINHSKKEIEEKCKITNQNIDVEFEKIESIANFLIKAYKSGNLNDDSDVILKQLISTSSKIITSINITSNNFDIYTYIKENTTAVNPKSISTFNLDSKWQVDTDENITYLKKIDNQTVLTIFIRTEEITSLLYAQFDKEKYISVLSTEKGELVFSSQLADNKFNKEILRTTTIDDIKKTLLIKTTKGPYYSYSFYNKNINLYLTVVEPVKIFVQGMLKYTFFWILISIISIILFISMVFSSSYRLTKSMSDIVKSIKNSKYLNLNVISYKNEAVLIAKSFDILENRVKLYEQNLEKITTDNLLLQKDLKIAQKLQRNLLPTLIPSLSERIEFNLYAISDSVYDIGGDLFDYFLIDENHLLIAVADVSGKGIPASLFMIYTHTLLRSIPTQEMNVSKIVENLNNKLIEENISDMFVTIFLGILNLSNGEFRYCNAAHCTPLLIDKEGLITEITDIHGIPVGIYPKKKYAESTIMLKEEDHIFIYTDGLTDTIDENGLKYSIDVLKYNMMGSWFLNSKEVVEKITRSITNFRGNIDPEDDLTILDLQYKPRGK